MNEYEIYIDGASKGNPGHSGVGIVICSQGEVVKNIAHYIGGSTNNFAEYSALIHALEEALIMKAECVRIKSDSELLCRQINKEYKVRNANIIGLYRQAVHLMGAFKEVTVRHIPREENKGADMLANKAVADFLKKKS